MSCVFFCCGARTICSGRCTGFSLPVACSGKHAEDVSEAIKMRRRNTIQRDAMHASIKDEHIEHHVHA